MKKTLLIIYVTLIALIPTKVYAAPPRIQEIGGVLDNVMGYLTPIGALLAVGMVVYAGYMWMISAGDANKTQEAQGTITWAVLGLIFLVIFRLILREVFDFLGQ